MMEGATAEDIFETFRRFGRDEDRLRPIDLLVRHREIYGFATLNALDALIAATVTAGPDQSHLNKPLVDDGQEIVKKLRDVAALREFCRDVLGFALETSSLTKAQFVQQHMPQLMDAMELSRWARSADSRALRLKLHTLQLTQQIAPNGVVVPTVFPNGFRVRVVVSWKNVLNKDVSELHSSGADLFFAPDCSSESGMLTPSNSSSNFHNLQSAGATASGGGGGGLSASSSSMSQPTVDISRTFHTTCSTSCTIRIAIDTSNGLEFAHGFVRASFLPGEAAPNAYFSVPLLRPANLSALTQQANLKTSSSKSSKSSSKSKGGENGGVAADKKNNAATISAAAAAAAVASGASRHMQISSASDHNGNSNNGVLVGTMSVELDSIASSFANLLAIAMRARRTEVQGRQQQTPQQHQQQQQPPAQKQVDEKQRASGHAAAATSSSLAAAAGIEKDESGSTVAYFLRRLQESSATRQRPGREQQQEQQRTDSRAARASSSSSSSSSSTSRSSSSSDKDDADRNDDDDKNDKSSVSAVAAAMQSLTSSSSASSSPVQARKVEGQQQKEEQQEQEEVAAAAVNAVTPKAVTAAPSAAVVTPSPAPTAASAAAASAQRKGHSNAKKYMSFDDD